MPERRKGEPINAYIGRFTSDPHEKREFPNIKQRLAVGYAEARRKAAKGAKHASR